MLTVSPLVQNEFRLSGGPDWSVGSERLRPGVTVVLRTRDRPVFLRRALASIAAQRFPDITVCLINDGGDPAVVEAIVDAVWPKALALDLVHNERSVGQPAALNQAFDRVDRRYFAVHDDDDTWAPDFLRRMAGFLEEPHNRRFIGAISQTDQIAEVVANGAVVTLRQDPYFRHSPVLSLIELLQPSIHPPPIGHLMRHAALAVGGPMNPELPVMYDFEWTVRVLREADIATVPEVLAFYHLRCAEVGGTGPECNSVAVFKDDYARYGALLRNQLFREELSRGSLGLGYISNLVHVVGEFRRSQLDLVTHPEILDYLLQRSRSHGRRRRLRRALEAPFRHLRELWRKTRAAPS